MKFLIKDINDKDYSTTFNSEFEKIEFVSVSFMYPNTTKYAIRNFTYTFEANKTYGLVGLSGSGKATLLKILLGLYENYEGKILVDGVDMNTIFLSIKEYIN
ncbi:ABC transporter family protein [Lachnotalea glycerini]|uniref:ABC transporter family protein n=1 Tax=Lachnotalea glycerini TaxID=1763509 RepID=A0A318EN62_9FIRM|nr:ATP-binding cassette domain-containing protein [Lachnotalea glycerini]PXV91559.1 ABC transporter family protein [Lachnotalea glycerini]